MNERLIASYHEAAHLVVAIVLDRHVTGLVLSHRLDRSHWYS
jgi:hypothetical protein